jgi:hypothetical protein
MKFEQLKKYFDVFEIVDNHLDLDREFLSVSERIFTDGEVKFNVNREGYLHITSVQNAMYILFIDTEHNLYCCVFKYIPTTKFKEIIRHAGVLKRITENDYKIDKDYLDDGINVEDDLIDINEFTCTECDCEDTLIFTRSATNPDALITKCNKCCTDYTFVPSKYYKLSSKKVIYFKSEKSSRNIDLEDKTKNIDNSTLQSIPYINC